MIITRRKLLRKVAITPPALAWHSLAPGCSGLRTAQSEPTLREAAADVGLLFGSDSDFSFRNVPPAYERLFVRQCALYAGNLNWRHIAPDPTHEDVQSDPNVAIALASGLRLTGAHLLWYRSIPAWYETLSVKEARSALASHIQRLAGYYRGRCFSWNVINEAIEPSEHNPDGLRVNTPLRRMLDSGLFEVAFREARVADPGAILLYNDYFLELSNAEHEARRSALFRLLDRLQKAQVPIDGVGLQSHLRFATFGAFDEQIYRRFLHDLSARGLKIVISELDVDDIGLPADKKKRDDGVAEIYTRFLSVALDEPTIIALVTWGICDAYSWHNRTEDFPEYIRKDHQPQRPLVFDSNLRPMPAFYAVLHALEQAPRRPFVTTRHALCQCGSPTIPILDRS